MSSGLILTIRCINYVDHYVAFNDYELVLPEHAFYELTGFLPNQVKVGDKFKFSQSGHKLFLSPVD